ncbi:MAG: hypothetical protein V2I33_06705, partial [Kangiellaceae bacterium]|nr:hypothetical protein [Kangiellaceae bacterium]
MSGDKPIIGIKFLELMLKDGIISKDDFAAARVSLRNAGSKHPIVALSRLNLTHAEQAKQVLDDDYLANWYAEKAGMEFVDFDPLKLDVDAITSVMSKAF